MSAASSKHDASAENGYESWSQAQLEAELAAYGYRWAQPGHDEWVKCWRVARVLDTHNFRVYVYFGPMCYWHFCIVEPGVWPDQANQQKVEGGAGQVMFAATCAALRAIDRVVARAADKLRDD